MECPNYKTIRIPACVPGVLSIQTALSEGEPVFINLDHQNYSERYLATVLVDGYVNIPTDNLNYFSDSFLTLNDPIGDNVEIGGYDGYKLQSVVINGELDGVYIDLTGKVSITLPGSETAGIWNEADVWNETELWVEL